ncbi:MAG: hypothetical protein K8L99_13550 [Anaerolineae bacterium]|nr:hypothetical protein [Anaerolineae bacterium]
MQSVVQEQPQIQSRGLAISLEWVAYALILVLALVLRFAELDTVPLTAHESQQALAAWRMLNTNIPGGTIVPESPLLFLLHSLGFATLGASETSARLWTAFAGVFLVMSPLLFRDLLGGTRTLLLSILLLCSPVLLLASRFDTPVIWAMSSAVLGLWALWRWWRLRRAGDALLVAVCMGALLLLTDPAGWVLALILVGAGVIALMWERGDDPDLDRVPEVRARLREWPWQQSLLVTGLVAAAVSTIAMLYPSGLSSISQLLAVGLGGVFQLRADAPIFYPLLTALVYEPVIWLFGIAALWMQVRRGTMTFLERFFAAWLVLGGIAAILYRGGGPEHALWLVIPATVLASWTFAYILEAASHPFLEIPRWSKLLLSLGMMALLAIFVINIQAVGRAVLRTQDGSLLVLLGSYLDTISNAFSQISSGQPVLNVDAASLIWALIALALMILGGFMAANTWGTSATLRGGALGLLVFGIVTSLGSGWAASVPDSGNAVELWHTQATGREVFLLRDTLAELSERESGGFARLPLVVLAEDDGVVAWTLRDFTTTVYIADVNEARTQSMVLLPTLPESPSLGGDYVGQDFILSRNWSLQSLQGFDFLTWWFQRRTRLSETPDEVMVLWLRQDVYNGVPFDPAQGN